KSAEQHIKNKDTLSAINDFVKAAEYGFEPRQAFSEAIYHSLYMNRLDEAMRLSFRMVDKGFRDFGQMETRPFTRLKEHDEWRNLKAAIQQNKRQYEALHNKIDNIKIVLFDIDNFWNAYDLAKNVDKLSDKRKIYLEQYFQKGSKGLQDFTFKKIR
ncbi:unnamed protein product, partial [Ectocarpus sp. 13 AM-2016]